MSQTNYQWPAVRRILPDVLAFALGLGTAWILDWKTTDLVWSLWLCSLILGYLTMLSTFGAAAYLGVNEILHEDFASKHGVKDILIGSALWLFLLGFFALHFFGFHTGHGLFLWYYFPIDGLPRHAFFDAFMNPIFLWNTTFPYVLAAYGAFLIPAIIAERSYVFASITEAVKAVQDEMHKRPAQDSMQFAQGRQSSNGDHFFRPYINVVRMHFLILFFGFCHALKVESFYVYAAVYAVYFFPWKAFRKNASDTPTGTLPGPRAADG